MPIAVADAKFIGGTNAPEKFRGPPYPQVVIIGRSNVGKSTFINRLANNSKLARTSKTPGRTREFNFFEFRLKRGRGSGNMVLVDAPGFGYAKVSKEERLHFTTAMTAYVEGGEKLKAVVLLNDARREPEELEMSVRDFALSSGLALLVVATKLDKLTKNEQRKAMQTLGEIYELSEELLIPAGERVSTDSFWTALDDAIALMA